MDLVEEYNNPEDLNYNNSCVIYTKILGPYEIEKRDNKFLDIKGMIEKEKIGNEIFNNSKL